MKSSNPHPLEASEWSKYLGTPDKRQQARAVFAVAREPDVAACHTTELINLLCNNEGSVAAYSALAIANVSTLHPSALTEHQSTLLDALSHPLESVRFLSAAAIARSGPKPELYARLKRASSENDSTVSQVISYAADLAIGDNIPEDFRDTLGLMDGRILRKESRVVCDVLEGAFEEMPPPFRTEIVGALNAAGVQGINSINALRSGRTKKEYSALALPDAAERVFNILGKLHAHSKSDESGDEGLDLLGTLRLSPCEDGFQAQFDLRVTSNLTEHIKATGHVRIGADRLTGRLDVESTLTPSSASPLGVTSIELVGDALCRGWMRFVAGHLEFDCCYDAGFDVGLRRSIFDWHPPLCRHCPRTRQSGGWPPVCYIFVFCIPWGTCYYIAWPC